MTSCNFNINFGPGVEGNGNVITKERNIDADFNNIKVSRGIEVHLTVGEATSVTVEADENLHEIITTEVDSDNNVLRVSTDENIKSATAKKVFVTVNNINGIFTTSGASVYAENSIKTEKLKLESSSGSNMDLSVNTDRLHCESSSGSSLSLTGSTKVLTVEASSGSYITASDLEAQVCRVEASSGSNISVNTSKELSANASSGANIKYSGNPEKVDTSGGVSGTIRRN